MPNLQELHHQAAVINELLSVLPGAVHSWDPYGFCDPQNNKDALRDFLKDPSWETYWDFLVTQTHEEDSWDDEGKRIVQGLPPGEGLVQAAYVFSIIPEVWHNPVEGQVGLRFSEMAAMGSWYTKYKDQLYADITINGDYGSKTHPASFVVTIGFGITKDRGLENM